MKRTLLHMLKELRLSGLMNSLEVRLQEATNAIAGRLWSRDSRISLRLPWCRILNDHIPSDGWLHQDAPKWEFDSEFDHANLLSHNVLCVDRQSEDDGSRKSHAKPDHESTHKRIRAKLAARDRWPQSVKCGSNFRPISLAYSASVFCKGDDHKVIGVLVSPKTNTQS
jgi:hypothetical protein